MKDHIKEYGCLMTAYTMLFQDRGLNVTVVDLYRQKYRSLNNNREPEEDVAKNGEAKLSNLVIGNIPNEIAVREGYQYRDNSDHSLLGSTTAERIADLQRYIRDHDGSIVVNVAFRGSDPDWGHWIVVDGYNADGSFTVRDPLEPEGMNNVRIGEKLGDGIKYTLFKREGKYKIRYIERVGESL